MWKKLTAVSVFLWMGSTVALADSMLPYFGAEVGVANGNWQIKDTALENTNANENGTLGNLFTGLSWTFGQQGYLGLELFGGATSARTSVRQISVNSSPTDAKLRMKYSFGASFLPGIKFTDATLVFLRLGGIRSRFELNQAVVPVSATSNVDKSTISGGQVGVGLQATFANNWGVRGEYDYTAYRTFTAFSNKISARDNLIKAGIFYNFC